MSELEIRCYRPEDAEAVMELHVAGLSQMGAYTGDGPWNDDLRDIEAHYLSNGGEFLVGLYQGRLATMGAFRRTGPHEAEIKRMRTQPEWQGRGFGQQLYLALEQKARALGYTRLHLDTGLNMYPAQRFYTRTGFIETHRGYVHQDQLAIFYEKHLG